MTAKVQQDFIVGALIGGVVGAAVALMLAPLPGAKLRHQIADGISNPLSLVPGGTRKPRKKAGIKKSRSVKKAVAAVKPAAKSITRGKKVVKKAAGKLVGKVRGKYKPRAKPANNESKA